MGDLIQAFKVIKIDIVDSNAWFQMSSIELRSRDYKLYKQPCHLDIRKYF